MELHQGASDGDADGDRSELLPIGDDDANAPVDANKPADANEPVDANEPTDANQDMDSGMDAAAAKYLVDGFSNGSANADVMSKMDDKELANAGLPKDVDTFLSTGTFEVRLPNKDEIVKAWTEIQSGL